MNSKPKPQTLTIQHRRLSTLQKICLVLVWIAAIGGIILLAQQYPPSDPLPVGVQAGIIFGAFILTIFICSFPSGKTAEYKTQILSDSKIPEQVISDPASYSLIKKIKITAYIILGSLWASCVALMLMGTKIVYEHLLLRPLCQWAAQNQTSGVIERVNLLMPVSELNQLTSRFGEIECHFSLSHKVIFLTEIMNKPLAFVIGLISAGLVAIIPLFLWYWITARVIRAIRT